MCLKWSSGNNCRGSNLSPIFSLCQWHIIRREFHEQWGWGDDCHTLISSLNSVGVGWFGRFCNITRASLQFKKRQILENYRYFAGIFEPNNTPPPLTLFAATAGDEMITSLDNVVQDHIDPLLAIINVGGILWTKKANMIEFFSAFVNLWYCPCLWSILPSPAPFFFVSYFSSIRLHNQPHRMWSSWTRTTRGTPRDMPTSTATLRWRKGFSWDKYR